MAAIADALRNGARRIRRSRHIDHWQDGREDDDVEQILATVLGLEVDEPIPEKGRLSSAQLRRFEAMVDRRALGEPVALVTGHFDFRGLRLATRRGVFVPRYSSEFMAEMAVTRLRKARGERVAVDVCTGLGPLALSMASDVPQAHVWGLDISAEAVALGKRNARALGLSNVDFARGDLLEALPEEVRGTVRVFTMHPPYVARGEVDDLPKEIREFEPVHTLTDSSDDGLYLSRRLIAEAPEWIALRGWVMIEIGGHLAPKVTKLMRNHGYVDVTSKPDPDKVTRVVSGRRPKRQRRQRLPRAW